MILKASCSGPQTASHPLCPLRILDAIGPCHTSLLCPLPFVPLCSFCSEQFSFHLFPTWKFRWLLLRDVCSQPHRQSILFSLFHALNFSYLFMYSVFILCAPCWSSHSFREERCLVRCFSTSLRTVVFADETLSKTTLEEKV